MNAHIVTIGDEILIGQIIDTNSAWMAQQLNLQGIDIVGISTVKDTEAAIIKGVWQAAEQADIILITGGLGPTKDDVTKKSLATYFGTELVFNDAAFAHLVAYFKQINRPTNQAHHDQCYLPKGVTLIHNGMGTAPGMWFRHKGKVYVSMPGVPYEMKYIMAYGVLPKLREQFQGIPIAHRTILTAGVGESNLAQEIEDFESNLPDNIKLAYLPNIGRVRLRLSGKQLNGENIEDTLDGYVDDLKKLIPHHIYGYEKEKLEAVIGQLLLKKGKTLGTFESCTGGAIAAQITTISGASAYFQGSVVAYSNAIKMNILGVHEDTLATHGAVSEQTVKEMVSGGLKALGVDFAIAVSGIAGPTGGTPTKPVGTIWIAVGDKKNTQTFLLRGTTDRDKNIKRTVVYALNLLRKFLMNE